MTSRTQRLSVRRKFDVFRLKQQTRPAGKSNIKNQGSKNWFNKIRKTRKRLEHNMKSCDWYTKDKQKTSKTSMLNQFEPARELNIR